MRGLGEAVTLIIVVAVALAAAIAFATYVAGVVSSVSPRVSSLSAAVAGAEVAYEGPEKEFQLGSGVSFRASRVYVFTVVIANPGTSEVTDLSFDTLSLRSDVTVCESDSCTVFDPVALALAYGFGQLPDSVPAKGSVTARLVVLSKVDLYSYEGPVLAVRVTGRAATGERVTAFVTVP